MHPQQRVRFVDAVIQDLGSLTGNFEPFGYRFMDRYQPAKWDHRGTNVAGAPVKSAVDSVDAGALRAAEYSTNQNYFSDPKLGKLRNDLEHIAQTHPTVKFAWLLSSRLATGGEMTKARRIAAQYVGVEIDVLDARRIAEFIVDNLHDEPFIGGLSEYLPFLAQLRNEWALSHQIPHASGYIAREGDEVRVLQALDNRRVVVITGISGAGKTMLSSRVAEELQRQGTYELILWQDAAHLSTVEQLRSVPVDASGGRENVLGYLKRRKCLLVLDNVLVDDLPRRVAEASSQYTKVLATSQVSTNVDDAIPLELVDRTTARAIVSAGLDSVPSGVFDEIYQVVGGHPLTLGILNSLVTEHGGNWSVAQGFGTSGAVGLPDVARKRVCLRLLEQHRDFLAKELAFIAWVAAPLLDVGLLRFVCGKMSDHELRRRHFVSEEAYGAVRLNDLVFESVIELAERSGIRELTFATQLARYVEEMLDADRAHKLQLVRAIRIHRDLIERLLGASNGMDVRVRSALRYAYSLVRDENSVLALLGDPVAEADRLASSSFSVEDKICVRSIIEVIEATFSILKTQKGEKAAAQRHQQLLPAFRSLLNLPKLPDALRLEIELHQAKAFAWAGEKEASEIAFRSVLAQDPNLAAARMQLGRLFAQRAKGAPGLDTDAAMKEFEAIMAAKAGNVAVTVSLASFDFLQDVSQAAALAAIGRHHERLVRDLREAVAARLEQPFKVVANLATKLWYVGGELLEEPILVLLRWQTPAMDDGTLFAWAQIQKQAAKSSGSNSRLGDAGLLLRGAVATYEQMTLLSDWQRVQFAECLTRAGECVRAIETLNATRERSAHWYHRMAEALHGADNLPAALSAIETAVRENKQVKYRSTFLRTRWSIRRDQHDELAIYDLREAHMCCEPGKFKEQIGEELRRAEAGSEGHQ